MSKIIDEIFEVALEDKLSQEEQTEQPKRLFDHFFAFKTITYNIRNYEMLIISRTFQMIPGCEYDIGTYVGRIKNEDDEEQYYIVSDEEREEVKFEVEWNHNTVYVCFSIKHNTFITMKNLWLTFNKYHEFLKLNCYCDYYCTDKFEMKTYTFIRYLKFPPGNYFDHHNAKSWKREFGYGAYEKKIFDLLNRKFFDNSLIWTKITFSEVFKEPFAPLNDTETTWMMRFNKQTIRIDDFSQKDIEKCLCEYINSYLERHKKSRGQIFFSPKEKTLVFFIRAVCDFVSEQDNFVWLITCLPFDGTHISNLALRSALHVMFDEQAAERLHARIRKLNFS